MRKPCTTTCIDYVQVTELDGRALLCSLKDPARCLTRIIFDCTEFRCFQGNNSALLGIASSEPGYVLVARLTDEALIVVMGSSNGNGSFLFEVQQNLSERRRRQMAPQSPVAGAGEGSQQAAQLQKRVILPPSSLTDSQNQVVAQLHS